MDTSLINFVGNGYQVEQMIKAISELPDGLFLVGSTDKLLSKDLEARTVVDGIELYPRNKIVDRVNTPDNAKGVHLMVRKNYLGFYIERDGNKKGDRVNYLLYSKNPYTQNPQS